MTISKSVDNETVNIKICGYCGGSLAEWAQKHDMQDCAEHLRKENIDLRKRVEKLERDSAMLDWLTKTGHLPQDVYAMAWQRVEDAEGGER